MTRTLVVTNDFPPRPGGIQAFVYGLVSRLPASDVVVYAPAWRGAEKYDAGLPFPVVRHPGSLMLPEPGVLRRAADLARRERCGSVLFGAAAPLALLAPRLRRAGAARCVALTHGHEAGWAALPGPRALLRRVGENLDAMTYLGEYTRTRLARALTPQAAARMVHLPPGVDAERFAPGAGGAGVRSRLGLGEGPVVACVSRLVPRKGQDALVRAWPRVRLRIPEAQLLLVGGGPGRHRLAGLAQRHGVAGSVWLTGSVGWAELPAYYDAADVFAMPCRDRLGGLDTEGLGIVYLEASATGLPVVAGDAGGAPEVVRDGETGHVVDGRSVEHVADAVAALLADPGRAHAMGERGRAWVRRDWTWEVQAQRLATLLQDAR